MTAEQPSVEALVREALKDAADYIENDHGTESAGLQREALVALDSLTAALKEAQTMFSTAQDVNRDYAGRLEDALHALERAEREKLGALHAENVSLARAEAAEARAQKAEAVVEAARAQAADGWARVDLRAALTAYDEPPTEQA